MTPRVLAKAAAAAYCGCATLGAFDGWRAKGILPGPIPGTTRWDIKALDAALDRASGLATTPSDHLTPYQCWKAEQNGEGSQAP